MIYKFDSFRKTVEPQDPTACWSVQWIEEPFGWQARIRERGQEGWGPEHIIYFKGQDFRPVEALVALEQLKKDK